MKENMNNIQEKNNLIEKFPGMREMIETPDKGFETALEV